ncbi:hypothetical protein AKJ65_07870 [candidate division MSBL1 archaeon SCGC-AAA259E19]|uniref:tRNA (guanine(26)-N(2))-dimethyltransferase n=1 Tax=candidate division MSBL1 archaeon SCGC-AAA259E19 TaxID=1698264 RepID=A0A133UDI1_9EURY|nr:hypothetical protein AKJ65_07870 [candidate division MSBL1 archaeon SCGC-AAA259E19]
MHITPTSPKEYVPSQTPVFFNPVMELSRDISVSSLQSLIDGADDLRVCDALAGVGARGLRYAKEVDGIEKVIVNDRSPEATELIRKNIELNDLSSAEMKKEDANLLLDSHPSWFHMIELDPFGSPVPFLDSSFSSIYRRGIFFVTATDTAPLCGAYPRACIRKYGSRPLRTPYSRELGLRIMIGFLQRRAAARDLALEPKLSHATQHYFRVHFRSVEGAKRADKILKEQGYVSHCYDCRRRLTSRGMPADLPSECECGREFEHGGPMWLGDLADKEHLRDIVEDLSTRNFDLRKKEERLLRLLRNEAEGPATYYDIHEVSSKASVSPPKFKRLINRLQDRGHVTLRTHFSDTGLRTDAPMEVLMEIVSE